MIVGLTSAARANPFAALLLDELRARGVPAGFVLSAERGPLGDVLERLQRRGLSGALRAARRRALGGGPPSPLAEVAAERGLDLGAPLASLCAEQSVEVVRVDGLSTSAAADAVRARRADVLVNAGGGLFRRRLLAAPRLGILNAHMAPLPEVRGVDVLDWSVLLGRAPGVTVHWLDDGVDTGRVLAFEPLPPAPGDSLDTLRERGVLLGAGALAAAVSGLASGAAEPAGAAPVEAPEGVQYFALHPRLRGLAAARLAREIPAARRAGDD